MRLYILLLLIWIPYIWGQRKPPTPCRRLPGKPDRAKPISQKLKAFADLLARTWRGGHPKERFDFNDPEYKEPATPPIRKEYRQMTNKERNLFHQALEDMYNGPDWHSFVNEHRSGVNYAPAAHGGLAFVCWHRQYLHVLEKYLRKKWIYRNVYIPYWDIALDADLPDPRHSALWTKYYWGKNKKKVTNGKLCKNWVTTPICHSRNIIVYRNIMKDPSMLFSHEKISNLCAFDRFASWAPRFEDEHGVVHCYLGRCPSSKSHISDLTCAPNDPVFFIYHAFLDCLFDEWQDKCARPGEPFYPWAPSPHGPNDPMKPFPGCKNRDGLRKNFYNTCTKRPSLIEGCKNDGDCGSPPGLLFCHECVCMGKIREKGNCKGMPDNACYCHNPSDTPRCINNKCRCL